ncbi:MAG: DUF4386 family protein [Betaproteobacteria bacterium]
MNAWSRRSPWGLVAGTLSALVLAISVLAPMGGNELAYAAAHRGQLILGATILLTWAVLCIPFVATLGEACRPLAPALALSATIASSLGIALLGFGVFMHIGALLAIVAETTTATGGADAHQAAIWSRLGYFLTDPGLMTWGLGQLLFGWLTWAAPRRWLGGVNMIGGIAGLLTLAVYQSGALALVQLASFTVVAFSTRSSSDPIARVGRWRFR